MPFISVTEPFDPRLGAYRDVRERDLVGRQGRFVAEGEVVLGHLLGPHSRFEAESVLIAEARAESLAPMLTDVSAPVFVAHQAVMDQIVGFPIHRGILGIGRIGAPVDVGTMLAGPAPQDRVLVACGIGNHDNMGGLFRAAAGFGARAVILDSTSCDPLYRKAIRVSVGAALITPFARLEAGGDMAGVLAAAGYEPWALTPSAEEMLAAARPRGPTAIIVGAEGPGLPTALLERCRRIGIPMAEGFDSLNVATAAAIALHHLGVYRQP